MKNSQLKIICSVCALLYALVLPGRAGTLTNNFTASFDYVANGIIGDTNWDGVYLRYGDILGGDPGGSGNGNTLMADTTHFGGGYLGIQSIGTDWAGTSDDGFFIYKVVEGDFDVSVQSAPFTLAGGTSFDNGGYNFPGLMVRAYNTNNSGSPFSTTTSAAENFLGLWRFNEFGLDGEIRSSTNGANAEVVFPGSNTEITSTRYFRITRVGNVFTFYVKTNVSDAWFQVTGGAPLTGGTLTRNDWAGIRLQVGISQATFNTVTRDAMFTDFELSGPNVTFPALPAAPSSLVITSTNIGGSLTFSWNVGTPGDGSLVVISKNPIQHNPVQGITYTANSTYGDPNSLLGGNGEYVVYNGTGTSVIVTNLGANNITYYVAVFEHSGSGSSTVYNTASPATNALAGPGVITGATIAVPINSIPVGGAVALKLIASFSTGETSDQSANTTWSSGNPSVGDVNGVGTVSGFSIGSALITATFGSFTPSTTISVTALPAFVDSFTATHSYLTNGLMGTAWDGLFKNLGDLPGGAAGTDGDGVTTVLDSQISNTNGLSMTSLQSTWQDAGDDGPFLFKIVTGDFQAVTHVNSMNQLNFTSVGLMARLFNPANGGPGPNAAGNEYHVNYWKVQNGSTSVRATQDGVTDTIRATGPSGTDTWLLMQRVNSTNFYFLEKATSAGLWTLATNMVVTSAANAAPMEVGVAQQTLSGVNGIAVLDYFSADGPGILSPSGQLPPPPATNLTVAVNSDLSMTYSWIAESNGVPVASILVMRAGSPVSAQPTYGIGLGANPQFGAGQDLGGGNYVMYKSPNVPTTTNNTVTVTGLTPGVTYYAVVFTYAGPFGTRVFNTQGAISISTQDGQLLGIEPVPAAPVPLGGLGVAEVYGLFTGGARLNITPFATVTSSDTNVIKTMDGAMTGVGLGSASVTVVYSGHTNSMTVTVRPPTFTDNFGVNHDYLVAGVTGSAWDGLYNAPNGPLVPHSPYVADPLAGTTVADANTTSNNVLTLAGSGDGWENDAAGGFFLYKYVAGDFQTAIHINNYDIANYNMPGLLARAYSTGTNGTALGAPFVIGTLRTNVNGITVTTYGESWVSLCRFDEFGIGTYARQNLDSAVLQSTQPDQDDTNYWILIVRSKGTEFDFYKRLNDSDPWQLLPNKTHYSIPEFAGKPMQVGIMSGPWSGPGSTHSAMLEKFLLDTTTGSPLKASLAGANIILSWPAMPNAQLQSTTNLAPVNWQPVSGTPVLGLNGYSLTMPAGAGNKFFRLKE